MPRSRRPPDASKPSKIATPPGGGSPPGAPQETAAFRFRTRRRLIVALSVVVAGFVSALAGQLLVLGRLRATFGELELHEAETRLRMRHEGATRGSGRGEVPGGSMEAIFGALQEATFRSRQELLELQVAAVRWTAAMLLLVPVLGALTVAYLSRSVSRPLARFSEGAAALAGGDLDTRIEVDTRDEFGALAAELNFMALALKEHQTRLIESERAAGIGRIVAGVAHGINNPLQVMLGYLSINRDHADRRLAAQLALVEEETLRCKRVVEGLVELTRPLELGVAPLDVRELCEELSAELGIPGQPVRARLSVSGAGRVMADPRELRRALFHLMKNAVEAAGPTGEVAVRVDAAGDAVVVTVNDSGPGLAPEVQAHLFEPFFTTKPDGTGLGLAVSRAIARAHGGDVDGRSAQAGGAVFTLRLPSPARAT